MKNKEISIKVINIVIITLININVNLYRALMMWLKMYYIIYLVITCLIKIEREMEWSLKEGKFMGSIQTIKVEIRF
jgi:hypothetical protein